MTRRPAIVPRAPRPVIDGGKLLVVRDNFCAGPTDPQLADGRFSAGDSTQPRTVTGPLFWLAPRGFRRRYYETSGNSSPRCMRPCLTRSSAENCRAPRMVFPSLAFPKSPCRSGGTLCTLGLVSPVGAGAGAVNSLAGGGTLLTFPRFWQLWHRWAQQRQPSWPT